MRGLMLAGAAAALLSSGAGYAPTDRPSYAVMPSRQAGKTEAGSREDRKRSQRRRAHGRTHFGIDGGSTKLARRLRSNWLRGRLGSY